MKDYRFPHTPEGLSEHAILKIYRAAKAMSEAFDVPIECLLTDWSLMHIEIYATLDEKDAEAEFQANFRIQEAIQADEEPEVLCGQMK